MAKDISTSGPKMSDYSWAPPLTMRHSQSINVTANFVNFS